jgi:hypothetical protein
MVRMQTRALGRSGDSWVIVWSDISGEGLSGGWGLLMYTFFIFTQKTTGSFHEQLDSHRAVLVLIDKTSRILMMAVKYWNVAIIIY